MFQDFVSVGRLIIRAESWAEGWNHYKRFGNYKQNWEKINVCRRFYNSLFKSIAEHFHEHPRNLDFVELDELNADIKTNGWGVLWKLKTMKIPSNLWNLLMFFIT